ncbi:sodium:solute symporter family protein [uncultured Draconibacterium sp.]|uniref:sodium:solute symporter family protein n=1 Tax=uncultured Draconibacterium sp. TaxID=1573823 RepID=UPI0029C8E5B9|nr:sodium:solute symporter family protein [uncultured Draconibacterium sp.]
MKLNVLDLSIIIGYFITTILLGIYFTRLASKNIDSYFLGGRSMPWYILSVSNASGMFDVSGTMWLVSMLFVYGIKGIYFPWLWPFFNQIFMMVFLSVWLRRSNVLTGAEWITTRFGNGKGAKQSHIIVVVFALVSVIGFLGYAFVGIGKFAQIFLPWNLSANTYALILMLGTGIYVILGGLFSVVATDVLQFIIMTITSIVIAVIAINMVSPEAINAVVPPNWDSAFIDWKLDLDWSGYMDSVNNRIKSDGLSMFGAFVMMMLFKGFFISLAGPIPSHDMQRILSNKTPKHAAMMSGLNSVAMLIPRFLLVTSLTVLALVYFNTELAAMEDNIDFELILPYAIGNFIPTGLKGLIIAGLLAAFMSTISSYINVAPAYIVNDIYKKYINPRAGSARLVKLSYLASTLFLAIGIGFGYIIESIDSITQWIVTALWAGYAAPNMLKWYWWRFNGYGFFWGMLSGLAAAMITPFLLPGFAPIYHFPFIFALSLAVSIFASLLTPPEDETVTFSFYKTVRPWGIWEPIHQKVIVQDHEFQKNTAFKRDMFNVVIGIIWQLSLIAMPVYLVIQNFTKASIAFGITIITSFLLKKNWYNKLEEN